MTQFNTPEQFVAAGKANVETLVTLANSAIARAERLVALNLNTGRSVLEDSVASTKTILEVKTPQELASLQASLAQPMIDKAVSYGRSLKEIATEGQQEVAKLFEGQIADLNKSFNAALEQAAKSAPAGSEAVFSAIKSAVAASNSAYESVTKAAKQFADVAESNLSAATEVAVKAAGTKKAA